MLWVGGDHHSQVIRGSRLGGADGGTWGMGRVQMEDIKKKTRPQATTRLSLVAKDHRKSDEEN